MRNQGKGNPELANISDILFLPLPLHNPHCLKSPNEILCKFILHQGVEFCQERSTKISQIMVRTLSLSDLFLKTKSHFKAKKL